MNIVVSAAKPSDGRVKKYQETDYLSTIDPPATILAFNETVPEIAPSSFMRQREEENTPNYPYNDIRMGRD